MAHVEFLFLDLFCLSFGFVLVLDQNSTKWGRQRIGACSLGMVNLRYIVRYCVYIYICYIHILYIYTCTYNRLSVGTSNFLRKSASKS